MLNGLLWFDNSDERSIDQKLERAIVHYQTKFGYRPDTCYVHPSALAGGVPRIVAGLELRPTNTVLPNHFWIGASKLPEVQRPAA